MKAKKQFGQNFLIDKNIITSIYNLISCSSKDLVIEIGPGRGALTKKLKELPCNILCIEIDNDLKPILDKFEDEKCKVIYNDILNVDLSDLLKDFEYEKLYIVGNLPYYITSPIVEKIVKSSVNPHVMVFMVQKEVADRFSSAAGSKNYGYMTVFLNHYYDVTTEFIVNSKCFNPIPKVESAVIKLSNKKVPYNTSDEDYFSFVKNVFKMKRKTLKNNMSEYNWEIIKNVLSLHGYSESIRAEQLPATILQTIYEQLKTNK